MTFVPEPCEILWNENLTFWGFIAGKLGADPSLPRPFLIGIRGAKWGDKETHQPVHKPSYDDTFVLLVKSEQPIIFTGASYAYQKNSKLSPDTVKDGLGDVGSIRTGRYTIKDSGSRPYPIFTFRYGNSDRIPCHRDFDHDGVISEEEYKKSEELRSGLQVNSEGCYATAVLFHTGFDAPADSEHKYSIACNTTSLKWLKVMRDRAAPTGGVIDYHLILAKDLIPVALEAYEALSVENQLIT